MFQKFLKCATLSIMSVAITVPDYFALPYIGNSLFFFGEPKYPSDDE